MRLTGSSLSTVLAVKVWQVDGEQTIQVVAEKRDTVTWLGAVCDKLVKQPGRQACLKRAPAGCANAQAVSW